jgi:hypothetical protein
LPTNSLLSCGNADILIFRSGKNRKTKGEISP